MVSIHQYDFVDNLSKIFTDVAQSESEGLPMRVVITKMTIRNHHGIRWPFILTINNNTEY